MIWDNIHDLAKRVFPGRFVATSGGFDPIHVGHVECLRQSSSIGHLVVIVMGDEMLLRKKGYVFMPLSERIEIINAIHGVSHVVAWDDGTQFVAGALEILKPHVFTKGGDRTPETMAPCEVEVCKKIGCEIIYGVGGTKIQSSSGLVANARRSLHHS